VVGAYELLVAGQSAEERMEHAGGNPYRAFAALGLHEEDALESALLSVEETLPRAWKLSAVEDAGDPRQAAVQRQAERTWINGCIVGLLLERRPAESFDDTTLRSARQRLRSERPRTADWVLRLLENLGFAPKTSLHHATVLGASFMEALAEFEMTHEEKRSCLIGFGSLWLDGLLVGAQSTRLPRRAVFTSG
jgi:hypothetical protein